MPEKIKLKIKVKDNKKDDKKDDNKNQYIKDPLIFNMKNMEKEEKTRKKRYLDEHYSHHFLNDYF